MGNRLAAWLTLCLSACQGDAVYGPAWNDSTGSKDTGAETACPAFTLVLSQELLGDDLASHVLPDYVEDPSYTGPGLAVYDHDDDGDLDVALATEISDTLILENLGDGTLSTGWIPLPPAQALAAGDVDGDGREDLFMGRREGHSDTLVLAAEDSDDIEVFDSFGFTTGGSFADPDGDGQLDLAISRHLGEFDPVQIAAGELTGGGNRVLRQDQMVFEVDDEALPDELLDATSFQALWFDADGDLDVDLYWVNDFGWWTHSNRLMMNEGDGTLAHPEDSGAELAAATMGVSAGDIDGDGAHDLFLSDAGSPDVLLGDGGGGFYEATAALTATLPMTEDRVSSWGTAIVDLDLDGRAELVAMYGPINFSETHVENTGVVLPNGSEIIDPLAQRDAILQQQPDGTFVDVSTEVGFDSDDIGRAVVPADLDGDGRPELLSTGWIDLDTPFLRTWTVEGGCPEGLTVRIDNGALHQGARLRVERDGEESLHPLSMGAAFSSGPLATSIPVGEDGVITALSVELPDGRSLDYTDLASGELVVRP